MSSLEAYRRILITRMKFIGDVVLTTPIIRSVRAACPHAFIAYLGDKQAVSLLEHHPSLDEVISFDFTRPAVIEQTRIALLLRRRRFDLVLDLFGNPRSALLTYLSGAPVRVGLDRPGRGRLYTVRVKDQGPPKSAIEFHNQFIRAVGIPPASAKTEIFVTDEERREAENFLLSMMGERRGGLPRPLIGMHPGATWPAKMWLAERFGQLADRLAAEHGAQIIITAAAGDEAIMRKVTEAASRKPLILPPISLRQLAAVLGLCDAYISNDAGPMHIAAAVGTPTIGLFGPGEEQIWFPYDVADGHRVLRKNVPCHPCHLDFCNRTGDGFMECMRLLTVTDVLNAVVSCLNPRSPRHLR